MKPLWPIWRLVARGWASMGEAFGDGMTRAQVLDANDLLDALDEAKDEDDRNQNRK